jgi:aspartate racemase
MIGILGGMGPLATVDLMRKIVELTPALRDQDHVPVVVVSDPRVPDRVGPALGRSSVSPVPAMQAGIAALERAGADCIAIACNTAHYWYDELQSGTGLPILHIVDAVAHELRAHAGGGPVALLATSATLMTRLYHDRLAQHGFACIEPGEAEQESLIHAAIILVKQNRAREAGPLLLEAIERMRVRGAHSVVLACTELPVALSAVAPPAEPVIVDATAALAQACLSWWKGRDAAEPPAVAAE